MRAFIGRRLGELWVIGWTVAAAVAVGVLLAAFG